MRLWRSKRDRLVEDQATIVRAAVAGINDLVKEINDLVDEKGESRNGGKNGTKRPTG